MITTAFGPKELPEHNEYFIQRRHAKFVEVFSKEDTRATAHVMVHIKYWHDPLNLHPHLTEIFIVTAAKDIIIRVNKSGNYKVVALDENGEPEEANHYGSGSHQGAATHHNPEDSNKIYFELGPFGTDSQEHHEFYIEFLYNEYSPIDYPIRNYCQEIDATILPDDS